MSSMTSSFVLSHNSPKNRNIPGQRKPAQQVASTFTERTCQPGKHNYLRRPGVERASVAKKGHADLPLRHSGILKSVHSWLFEIGRRSTCSNF
jgi:hypothetical protein